MEGIEEFRKALKELQQSIERTKFYKTLIAVMDWMEERLEDLLNRRRGGEG